MSLHYILDGYNIIYAREQLSSGSLQANREALIGLLATICPQGRNRVTVVFDGQPDVWGPQNTGPSQVIFTEGESADDRIKQIVDGSDRPKDLVVVTNDRELLVYVRKLGASVMSVEDFLRSGKSKNSAGRRAGKNVNPDVARRINSELEDLWLKHRSGKREGRGDKNTHRT
ncbi:MAG: NYN domain-containing protein [Candidatus Omnitrophota bacterium]